jgi:hypothetical protein
MRCGLRDVLPAVLALKRIGTESRSQDRLTEGCGAARAPPFLSSLPHLTQGSPFATSRRRPPTPIPNDYALRPGVADHWTATPLRSWRRSLRAHPAEPTVAVSCAGSARIRRIPGGANSSPPKAVALKQFRQPPRASSSHVMTTRTTVRKTRTPVNATSQIVSLRRVVEDLSVSKRSSFKEWMSRRLM